MALTPATSRQTAQDSILDLNGRQIYLGNGFIVPATVSLSTTNETNVLLTQNATLNTKALFVNLRRFSSSAEQVLIKTYLNPTVASDTVQTITAVADSSNSLQSTYFTFYLPSGVGYYVWNNVSSGGTD